MRNIEIYSGSHCPYCIRAKELLQKRGFSYIEYDVQAEPGKHHEMLQRVPGARTIPQIFINGEHVGGCDELYVLERAGGLDVCM